MGVWDGGGLGDKIPYPNPIGFFKSGPVRVRFYWGREKLPGLYITHTETHTQKNYQSTFGVRVVDYHRNNSSYLYFGMS